jgi:hypothetical protein
VWDAADPPAHGLDDVAGVASQVGQ